MSAKRLTGFLTAGVGASLILTACGTADVSAPKSDLEKPTPGMSSVYSSTLSDRENSLGEYGKSHELPLGFIELAEAELAEYPLEPPVAYEAATLRAMFPQLVGAKVIELGEDGIAFRSTVDNPYAKKLLLKTVPEGSALVSHFAPGDIAVEATFYWQCVWSEALQNTLAGGGTGEKEANVLKEATVAKQILEKYNPQYLDAFVERNELNTKKNAKELSDWLYDNCNLSKF